MFSSLYLSSLFESCVVPQTLPVEGPITSVSYGSIFILIMASMDRSGRDAPMCCSHGGFIIVTFARLNHPRTLQDFSGRQHENRHRAANADHTRGLGLFIRP